MVTDFRLLNANTYDYTYDNLTIDELYEILAGARIINATDINKWFYPMPIDENSRK